MAEEQEKIELKSIIEIIKNWNPEQSPHIIKASFLRLNNFDQSQNADLWNKLMDAIYYNGYLNFPDLKNGFDVSMCRSFIREGYWWYNKSLWGSLG